MAQVEVCTAWFWGCRLCPTKGIAFTDDSANAAVNDHYLDLHFDDDHFAYWTEQREHSFVF